LNQQFRGRGRAQPVVQKNQVHVAPGNLLRGRRHIRTVDELDIQACDGAQMAMQDLRVEVFVLDGQNRELLFT
jgi:hypothetical protein